jgi:hypothetical protein
VQSFAWRMYNIILNETGEQDVPDDTLLQRVIAGLHPRVAKYLPDPHPSSLPQLFEFGDSLAELFPSGDPSWNSAGGQQYESPHIQVEIACGDARSSPDAVPKCYRCGEVGHFAVTCTRPRNRAIRPKKKKRKSPFQQK